MKPLRLTLQAFGSYAGELSVDFARLAQHGIFAITGPTGAGKSTVFDALVYALYDDLPGFREDGNVRSQFADPSTETFVRLDFEAHGEEWRVERYPAQVTARRRGTGTANRTSRVSLQRLGADGPALTRNAEVASSLGDLVGLSQAQFEQVVLIPQGRFEEVLKADTKTRAPLLRRLFPVDVYRRVTDELRAVAAERGQVYEEARRREADTARRLADAVMGALAKVPRDIELPPSAPGLIEGTLSPAALRQYRDDLSALRGRVDTMAVQAAAAATAATAVADQAERDATRYDRWRQDLGAVGAFEVEELADATEQHVLATAGRLAPVAVAIGDWGSLTRRLDTLDGACARARQAALAIWIDRYDRAGAVDGRHTELLVQRVTRDADDLAKATETHHDLERRSGDHHARRVTLTEQAERLAVSRTDLDHCRAAITSTQAARDALLGTDVELERSQALQRQLQAEKEAAKRRDRAIVEMSRRQETSQAATTEAEAAAQLAAGVQARWRQGLAGRLAENLVDGSPCPTCGADEHPHPAPLAPDAPDDRDLRAAEQQAAAARAAAEQASRQLGTAEGELRALQAVRPSVDVDRDLGAAAARLAAAGRAVAEQSRLAAELHDQTARLEQLGQRQAAEEAELQRRSTILDVESRQLDDDRRTFVALHGNLDSPAPAAQACQALAGALTLLATAQLELEVALAERAHVMARLTEALGIVGTDDPAHLADHVIDLDEIDRRATALDERAARRRTVRERIASYQGDGGPQQRPATEPLHLAAKLATERHLDLVARLAVIDEQSAVVATGPTVLEAADAAVRQARCAYEAARTLADRCAGTSAGAGISKLSLENWVLADYLRQVLVQANARLAAMTAGRFSLQLSDGVTDGRKSWGLDLSVFDVHTGQVRPATTLSGGETFMAALALALGLADVVSGGSNRRIGALFIDEGFGYLDPQALDAVIDVLRTLEDGGRIVGVISHVDEVTRALPAGITVEPSPSGSVATLHYPTA